MRIMTRPALDRQVGGDHYKSFEIQPAEYIYRNGIGFLEGNAIKYASRWKHKGGIDDLRKAIHCLEMLIQMELERKYEPVHGIPDKDEEDSASASVSASLAFQPVSRMYAYGESVDDLPED